MNEQIREYIDKYPSDISDMYIILRKLIFDSASSEPQEIMWAKLPSYYVGAMEQYRPRHRCPSW